MDTGRGNGNDKTSSWHHGQRRGGGTATTGNSNNISHVSYDHMTATTNTGGSTVGGSTVDGKQQAMFRGLETPDGTRDRQWTPTTAPLQQTPAATSATSAYDDKTATTGTGGNTVDGKTQAIYRGLQNTRGTRD